MATLGPGWYWGQAATAGGQQVIDGVVDDDPKKIFDGAVTLVETALEITKADQAIADALQSVGDGAPPEPPAGSRLAKGTAGGERPGKGFTPGGKRLHARREETDRRGERAEEPGRQQV